MTSLILDPGPTPLDDGVAVDVEKEVVHVVVSTEQQERVFEQMYLAGELDTPGMGIMYITPLEKAATYVPDEILRKLSSKSNAE